MLYLSCSGFSTTTIWMVEQLGFAMILSLMVSTLAFTSGTTNGIPGSILQADELSITVQPIAANLGASSFEVVPPALKTATCGFLLIAVSQLTTSYSFPLKE